MPKPKIARPEVPAHPTPDWVPLEITPDPAAPEPRSTEIWLAVACRDKADQQRLAAEASRRLRGGTAHRTGAAMKGGVTS